MKFLLLVALSIVGAVVASPSGAKYTDRYDNINLDEILSNKRLLIPYLNCILDNGKCTADGRELKSHIKEALEDGCEKCTETQRRGSRKVIGHLINNEPEYWKKLQEKYDKQRKFTVKYEQELRVLAH